MVPSALAGSIKAWDGAVLWRGVLAEVEKDRIEVITGVNLPILIKLAGLRESKDLLAVARQMRDDGRNAIWVASDLLRGEKSAT